MLSPLCGLDPGTVHLTYLCARLMDNGEFETGEVQGPSGVLMCKLLFCGKVDQIDWVSPNFERIFQSF